MNISKTNLVELHYRLHEKDENGEQIENNFDNDPLSFVFGVGMMIPGFEEHIEGMSVGDKKGFQVKSGQAYGNFQKENVVDIPTENFGDEEQRKELMEVDKLITLQDQNGMQHRGYIKKFDDELVTVDFNHPMAGKDLYFYVEVVSIRETTEEELEQMGLEFE